MTHLSEAIRWLQKESHIEMGQEAGNEANRPIGNRYATAKSRFPLDIAEVNKELWIILTLVALAPLMNYVISSHRMILSF